MSAQSKESSETRAGSREDLEEILGSFASAVAVVVIIFGNLDVKGTISAH